MASRPSSSDGCHSVVRNMPSYLLSASRRHWDDEVLKRIFADEVAREDCYTAFLSEGPVCLMRLGLLMSIGRFDAACALSDWIKLFLDDVGQQGQEFRESLDQTTRGELDVARCRILWELGRHKDLATEVNVLLTSSPVAIQNANSSYCFSSCSCRLLPEYDGTLSNRPFDATTPITRIPTTSNNSCPPRC